MTVEIRLAQSEDENEWDAINARSPHGTIFHQWNWLKIIEKHTRSILYPLIGMKGNTPIGIFPLFFEKKGPIRMVFSPPPYAALFYLGPVLAEYDSLRQEKRETNYLGLQNSVEQFIINNLKANYVSISLCPGLQDPRPFTWSGYNFEPQYDYIIDLSVGPDALFRTLNKKQRQNLKRAKKRGISIETGGEKEYIKILDLMDIRYKQQGKIVTVPRDYFLDLYHEYNDNIKIFIAKNGSEIITGSIEIQYKDTHYSWIGNPKPISRISPSPNDILIWESINHAFQHGYKYYVTMNAAGDKRLHSYYVSKFNPKLVIHHSLKRNSVLAGIFEKGYTNFLKPFYRTPHVNNI
jgi:hypothetical protein